MSSSDSRVPSSGRARRAACSRGAALSKWASGLVLLTALFVPGRAHAEGPAHESNEAPASERAAESEQLSLKAFQAYKDGRYETAIQFYNQALEAHAAAAIYYNVARIYDTKLSEPDKALEYYKKALDAPDVTETLVEKSLARIRVLTALAAQSKPNEEQAEPEERPRPTESDPPSEQRQPRDASKDEAPTSRRSTQKTIGYGVGITGLVAVGAGLGLGGWAMVERDKARETCTGSDCDTQDGVDAMNTAHDLATVSTITVAAGSALLAVGLGMVLFAPRNKPADQDSAKAQPRVGPAGLALAITPTARGAGLHLSGAFF